jgi:predicted tellurium resistance membrane protein TerC
LALFALPVLGLVMFYALFSMFLSRFAIPAYFVAVVVFVILIELLWNSLRSIGAGRTRAAA